MLFLNHVVLMASPRGVLLGFFCTSHRKSCCKTECRPNFCSLMLGMPLQYSQFRNMSSCSHASIPRLVGSVQNRTPCGSYWFIVTTFADVVVVLLQECHSTNVASISTSNVVLLLSKSWIMDDDAAAPCCLFATTTTTTTTTGEKASTTQTVTTIPSVKKRKVSTRKLINQQDQ